MNKPLVRVVGLVGLLGCLALGAGRPAAAGEWAHWRGPNRDGSSPETGLISSWSPAGENLIWKAEFTGRSTPVVFGGQACVIGRVGDGVDKQERVACFDAGTGQLRWENRFNVYNSTVPFSRVGWASLAGDPETGNVYAQGVGGQLIAYDHDGHPLWQRQLTEEFGRATGYGGRTQTPLVDGDRLVISFVNFGWGDQAPPRHRYYAFDKRTGDLVWVSTPGKMPYDFNTQSGCTPAEINGRHLLVCGNADGWVYALDAHTGEKIWGFELSRGGVQADVVVHGTRVYASHSEENVDEASQGRLVCIDGTGKGDVTKTHEVWRIDELADGFPSATYHDGRLYAVDNSANLHAIDAAKGTVLWNFSLGTVGKASPVVADGKLYVTEVNGRFHIIQPGDTGATALDVDELTVPDGRYAEIYGSPAIAYGRIYFAAESGLYCLGRKDLAFKATADPWTPPPPPAPAGGEPAWVQVVPAEVLVRPGEPVKFEARPFDAAGLPAAARPAEWTLEGLAGAIDGEGRWTPDAARRFQAGSIVAKVGSATGKARVRVMADLPWTEDFESVEIGKSPPQWIGANDFVVHEVEGRKVLHKTVREKGLQRSTTFLGTDTMANYTFEADVMGAAAGPRRPDIGIIDSGYTLDLMGAHQKVQLRDWSAELRIKADAPFAWEPNRWYKMKLRVELGPGRALVRGKVWPADAAEPEAWTVTAEDPHPIAAGSPGLIGYSPADMYYDNLKLTRN